MFLIDQNIALLQCTYELVDILKKIFCGCHRCFKFYLLNDKPAIKFEKQVTENFDHLTFEPIYTSEEQIDADKVKEQIMYKKSMVYGQFLNFLNYFSQINGFEALVGALKAGNESLEDRMPLDVMSLLVQPFRQCNAVFDATFKQGFIN